MIFQHRFYYFNSIYVMNNFVGFAVLNSELLSLPPNTHTQHPLWKAERQSILPDPFLSSQDINLHLSVSLNLDQIISRDLGITIWGWAKGILMSLPHRL